MAFNFLKLARALATASLVSGAGAAWADTSVTNTAGATIRINPYSVTATYDKSQSAAVQASGIGGFNLGTSTASTYINPLDSLGLAGAGTVTNNTFSTTAPTSRNLLQLGNVAAAGEPVAIGCTNTNICRNTQSSLLSVANSDPVLADIYAVTDTSGTFSLDISSKNADRFTARNSITSPTGTDIGVKTSGASSYQVTQQGVAGMQAAVLSPTKVELNTDAAGGGSTGQISLTSKSLSNGVQETYSTSGSVSVDGASAYVKANTTNHIALNAVNATISGTQTITSGSATATFNNTDIVATTFKKTYINSERESVTDQVALLSSGNYIAKDTLKGATSVKISSDPADQLRVVGSAGFPTAMATRAENNTILREAAPSVSPITGTIELPDYSTQTLTASGVTWVGPTGVNASGTSASMNRTGNKATTAGSTLLSNNAADAATKRGNNALSNVVINSAAGGGGVNSITSGGFGNTVNLQTTFDMTVFGR